MNSLRTLLLLLIGWGSLMALDLDAVEVRRLGEGPIIHPGTPGWARPEDARNINGPTLVRMPDWASARLGRWHCYFSHHRGDFIRLAFAEQPEGPWTIHPTGVLPMLAAGFDDHVASPEIVIDHDQQRILCFYHGQSRRPTRVHATRLAISSDGLNFAEPSGIIAPFYLRVWQQDGAWFGIAKGTSAFQLLRATDPAQPWERGPDLLPDGRHLALWPVPGGLVIVYSRIGDAPEHLRLTVLPTSGPDWRQWVDGVPPCRPLLLPEGVAEGADRPVEPSRSGAVRGRVNQLRDPHLVADGERILLTYAVAGESGIAIAEVIGLPQPPPTP